MPDNSCPLCESKGQLFFSDKKHRFFCCAHCLGIFRESEQILDREQEKNRYLLHQNHTEDQGYLKFVSPILESVRKGYKSDAVGLDFGCGHTPVISEVLKSENYKVDLYDPVFYPEKVFEGNAYDFIVCCEVMEHFQHPKREFHLLAQLLKPNGKLICMTSLYSDAIDFSTWYYKNDPTHVFLYRKETLAHIVRSSGFSHVKVSGSLVVFSK